MIDKTANPYKVRIQGYCSHTGFSINSINSVKHQDTAVIDLYFKECGGYMAITKYDTLFTPAFSFTNISWMKIRTQIDTNLSDTINCFYSDTYSITDSFFVNLNTGITETSSLAYLSIYPNPTNNILNISLENPNDLIEKITITDVNGRIIQEASLNCVSTTLHTEHLPSGVYIVQIRTESGHLANRKFVKN